MQKNPASFMVWILILVVPVTTAIFIAGFLFLGPFDILLKMLETHFAATVGLPASAVFCIFFVAAVQQAYGPLKFEGLGFKFEGSSGVVVAWAVCLLAIAIAIRLLWYVS